jgi:hypothetical protein
MREGNEWHPDGWAVHPGEGIQVKTGGPHWLEVLLRGKESEGLIGYSAFSVILSRKTRLTRTKLS